MRRRKLGSVARKDISPRMRRRMRRNEIKNNILLRRMGRRRLRSADLQAVEFMRGWFKQMLRYGDIR